MKLTGNETQEQLEALVGRHCFYSHYPNLGSNLGAIGNGTIKEVMVWLSAFHFEIEIVEDMGSNVLTTYSTIIPVSEIRDISLYKIGDKFCALDFQTDYIVSSVDINFINDSFMYNIEKYDPKHTIKQNTFIVLEEELKREYIFLKPSCETETHGKCQHRNKKKVNLITSAYWYCPDCKEDLGNA